MYGTSTFAFVYSCQTLTMKGAQANTSNTNKKCQLTNGLN